MLSGTCPGGVAVDPAFGPVVSCICAPWAFTLSEMITRAVTLILSQNPKPPLEGRWPGAAGSVGWAPNVRELLE